MFLCVLVPDDRRVRQARLSELGQPYQHACQSLGDEMLALPLSQLGAGCGVVHVHGQAFSISLSLRQGNDDG